MTPTSGVPQPFQPVHDDDVGLVRRMIDGDAAALGALYDRHGGMLFALALRITGDHPEAEEVVQDVFVHAWRRSPSFDARRATVAGWLVMMTRSRAIDRVRAKRARPGDGAGGEAEGLLLNLAAKQPGPEAQSIQGQTATRVRAALHELPDAMRRALELAYFDGLSQSDIAARLDEPLGTVKTRMRAALLRLRAALRSQHADE